MNLTEKIEQYTEKIFNDILNSYNEQKRIQGYMQLSKRYKKEFIKWLINKKGNSKTIINFLSDIILTYERLY